MSSKTQQEEKISEVDNGPNKDFALLPPPLKKRVQNLIEY